MAMEDLYFWQDWPLSVRRRFYVGLVVAWAALLAGVWWTMHYSVQSADKNIARAEAAIAKAQPLVKEYRELQGSQPQLSGMGAMAAAQQIVRDLKLEPLLSLLRPKPLGNDKEGVQMIFSGLNLPQLLELLRDLPLRGGLKTVSFLLNHQLENPKLADVQIIVTR